MTTSRIIPKLTIATAAGCDPDVIEVEDINWDIGDADQVYADERDVSLFALPPCPRNADGPWCDHGDALDPGPCRYCGAPPP